jgi:flavin-dependent dehydrogenase
MLSPKCQPDLAIIGGGPAGSSAAISAARAGARVVLFEARRFPRQKVCGEFVSAEALEVLSGLLGGIDGSPDLIKAPPVIDRTRLWFRGRTIVEPVSPSALSITRFDLDAALWNAAQAAGVECREQCEVLETTGQGPFILRTALGDVTARAIIVAAGRWSQFTADRVVPPGPKWIGVKGHFAEQHPTMSTDLYFFEHGYCGVQPVSDEVVNACAMVRSDRAGTLAEVLQLHPALAERAASWKPVMAPVSTAPLVYRRPQPVRDNIAFIGDAAAFIDPFVGDGISIALRSGKVAAECLNRFLSGKCSLEDGLSTYARQYEREFVPLLSAAARVRSLLSLNSWAQMAAFEALRLPGLLPLIIRKTRRGS